MGDILPKERRTVGELDEVQGARHAGTGMYVLSAAPRPRIPSTEQHSVRMGGCIAAGNPSAYPLRVNSPAQTLCSVSFYRFCLTCSSSSTNPGRSVDSKTLRPNSTAIAGA